MRAQICGVWLLALSVFAAGAQAQTVTIKIKSQPEAGKSVVHHDVEKQTGSIKVSDAGGKVIQEQKPDLLRVDVFTETVLEAAKTGKDPVKFKRAYEKSLAGPADKAVASPFQGRTILFELRDGKYQVTAEGQPELSAKELAPLIKRANDQLKSLGDQAFLPKKPVKVGESWPLDGKALASDFSSGGEVDLTKSKGEGKLLKTYKKDGKEFGVLEVKVQLALTSMPGLKFEQPATLDLTGTLDAAIDGTSTAGTMSMAGKFTGKALVEQGGMKFTVELALDLSGKKERSAEK